MADLTGFSSGSFDPSEWLNRALQSDDKPAASAEEIDAQLAQLSMKLQLMAQDCGDSLEHAMAEASTVMWRTANDVVSVEKSVASLQTAIQQLSEHICANQSRNIAGVDELFRLDIIKRNMEASRAILVEAAQWHQLVQEARAALSGQANLKAAAERVEALQRCLQVLKHIPEHSTRESVLQEIKTTLMSKLQPKLQAEIAADDPTQLQELVYVFRILGAEAQATEQYIQRKPLAISQQWEVLQAGSAQGRQFVQEFAKVCAAVQAMMRQEAHSTIQLFGSAAAPGLLCAMLKHVFENQKQGLASRLKHLGMDHESMSACFRVTSQLLQDLLPLVQDARIGDLRPGFIASLEPYLLAQDVFTAKVVAQLRNRSAEILASLNRSGKSAATFDDVLGDDGSLGGAHMAAMDTFVDACQAVLRPYSHSVEDAVRYANGVASRHHHVQMNQVLAEALQSLRQALWSLRSTAGLPAEDVADDTSPQTRADRSAPASTAGASTGMAPSSIERSEYVHAALRALQGIAVLVNQVAQADSAATQQYARSYEALFGGTVVNDDAGQVVSRVATGDFSKHVFNYLADTKQFGLADVRKFLYQFYSQAAPETGAESLVFAHAARAFHNLRFSSSLLLLDLCLDGPRQLLAEMSKLPVWTASSPDGADEQDPLFSAAAAEPLPQQLFTQLGERLLALVNLFDEFAESAGEQLETVKSDPVSLKLAFCGWKALASQLDPERRADVQSVVIDYTQTRQAIQAAEQAAFGNTSGNADRGPRSRATSEVSSVAADALETNFTDQWLRCIADAIVGVVLHQALRIRKLSKIGRTQLVLDLRYLSNVLETLSPSLPPLLPHVIQLLDEDVEVARKRYSAPIGANFVRMLENRIIALREDFD